MMTPTCELLDFEEAWPRCSGRKDEAIRARFDAAMQEQRRRAG